VVFGTDDVTATAGVDYVASTGVVTFANGESSKLFTIGIVNDTTFEQSEMFRVRLYGEVASPNDVLTVTVSSDDAAPPPPVSSGGRSGGGGGGGLDVLSFALLGSLVCRIAFALRAGGTHSKRSRRGLEQLGHRC
jgi:hypothetical protein